MFFQSQATTLSGIRAVGASRCGYAYKAEDWDDRPCDCKYGVGAAGRGMMSEATGCPELRSAYKLIAALSPEEYDALVRRVGGAQTDKLFNADEPTFEQMQATLRDIETMARNAR